MGIPAAGSHTIFVLWKFFSGRSSHNLLTFLVGFMREMRLFFLLMVTVLFIAVLTRKSTSLRRCIAPSKSTTIHHHVHSVHTTNDPLVKDVNNIQQHTFSVAPMMEYTDTHMRRLYRMLSAESVLYTEMITTNTLVRCGEPERYLEADFAAEEPLVLQLGGNEPETMKKATEISVKYGYKSVNINAGCPSEKVSGAGCFGAALMLQPDLLSELALSVGEALGKPATVKCRIGVNNEDSYEGLVKFIDHVSTKGKVTNSLDLSLMHFILINPIHIFDIYPPLNPPLTGGTFHCARSESCSRYILIPISLTLLDTPPHNHPLSLLLSRPLTYPLNHYSHSPTRQFTRSFTHFLTSSLSRSKIQSIGQSKDPPLEARVRASTGERLSESTVHYQWGD